MEDFVNMDNNPSHDLEAIFTRQGQSAHADEDELIIFHRGLQNGWHRKAFIFVHGPATLETRTAELLDNVHNGLHLVCCNFELRQHLKIGRVQSLQFAQLEPLRRYVGCGALQCPYCLEFNLPTRKYWSQFLGGREQVSTWEKNLQPLEPWAKMDNKSHSRDTSDPPTLLYNKTPQNRQMETHWDTTLK